ncbi:MAG: YggS family pyridoxal phosphate-dependent enzyme [Nitrospirae bacterium]|nr:MAG: YggS family pyridoxal phosphate-dependent enzyme [Nitrospirota bacterium]
MRAGRDPAAVRLLAVTKTVPPDVVKEAIDAGIRLVGENRVQEAEKKMDVLKGLIPDTVSWHMIGHLQKNKAKVAVRLFDLIESLDSIALAERIDRYARDAEKIQRVFLQVKLSPEETKTGIPPEDLERDIERYFSFKNILPLGLMTIPPYSPDPENSRPFFRRLRELREALEKRGFSLPELSMGMSGDYEVAVEEGATIVRVGTAIFGERVY